MRSGRTSSANSTAATPRTVLVARRSVGHPRRTLRDVPTVVRYRGLVQRGSALGRTAVDTPRPGRLLPQQLGHLVGDGRGAAVVVGQHGQHVPLVPVDVQLRADPREAAPVTD